MTIENKLYKETSPDGYCAPAALDALGIEHDLDQHGYQWDIILNEIELPYSSKWLGRFLVGKWSKTAKEILTQYKDLKFLVMEKKHVYAIVNGEVFDTSPNDRRIVENVFVIFNISDPTAIRKLLKDIRRRLR